MTRIDIRPQRRPEDLESIESMVAAAFAEHGGTQAFRDFRAVRDDVVSLVATDGHRIVGNILFSPVALHTANGIDCQWSGIPGETFMVAYPYGPRPDLTGKAVFDGL